MPARSGRPRPSPFRSRRRGATRRCTHERSCLLPCSPSRSRRSSYVASVSAGTPIASPRAPPPPPGPRYDTVEFHLNEALTNLYVGLHRELRGERLSAARFVQSYAVDRVIALLDLTSARYRRDPFEHCR